MKQHSGIGRVEKAGDYVTWSRMGADKYAGLLTLCPVFQ